MNRTASEWDIDEAIQSNASTVSAMLEKLSTFCALYVAPQEMTALRLALDEILQNAFEHGNLGFTSDEKIQLCEEETFEEAIRIRSVQALREGKLIHVQARMRNNELVCVVEDQGKGFNWRAAFEKHKTVASHEGLSGRGLTLIYSIFNKIEYNDSGNRIIVTKNLSR